ncbi:surface protein [Histomonas meleagridis]|uniref:surface protein n=1 Tax=Histomonas meleagridis TaxID=135588 RepID=UPI0035599227|nr:surface protein [Histomonas meleagridis]KAH0797069.1 surface protein [Histomonas meleagridis]
MKRFTKVNANITHLGGSLKFQLLRYDTSSLGYEAILSPSITITPLLEQNKLVGPMEVQNCFKITKINQKKQQVSCILKCPSMQSMINWVIWIYGYANRMPAPKKNFAPKRAAPPQEAKPKQLEEPKRPAPPAPQKTVTPPPEAKQKPPEEQPRKPAPPAPARRPAPPAPTAKRTTPPPEEQLRRPAPPAPQKTVTPPPEAKPKQTEEPQPKVRINTPEAQQQPQLSEIKSKIDSQRKREAKSVSISPLKIASLVDEKPAAEAKKESLQDKVMRLKPNGPPQDAKPPETAEEIKTVENVPEETVTANEEEIFAVEIPIEVTSIIPDVPIEVSKVEHKVEDIKASIQEEHEILNIPETNDLPERLEKLKKKRSAQQKREVFKVPSFEEISRNVKLSISMMSQSIDLMNSFLNELSDNINDLTLYPYTDKPTDDLIEHSIITLQTEVKYDFSKEFDFSINPEFDLDAFNEKSEPDIQYITEISIIDQQLRFVDQVSHNNDQITKHLCFLLTSLLLNGMKNFTGMDSTEPLVPLFQEVSVFLPELEPICVQMEQEKTTVNQALIGAAVMLENNSFGPFLHELKRSNDCLLRYYSKTALIRNDDFLETLLISIENMFNTHSFTVSPDPSIYQSEGTENIQKFILTPAFEYLDIDDIFEKESDVVSIISSQFYNGLKPKMLGFLADPWSVITDVSSIKRYQSAEWKNFVQSLSPFRKMNFVVKSKLEEWIKEGLKTKQLHIWLLCIIINQDKVHEHYFPEATLADLYRARYFAQKIAIYLRDF